jgi:hypothetical protein
LTREGSEKASQARRRLVSASRRLPPGHKEWSSTPLKESAANDPSPPLFQRLIPTLGYLLIAASPLLLRVRVERQDGLLLVLFALALSAGLAGTRRPYKGWQGRTAPTVCRLTFAAAIVFAYALGRRAWMVERFVQTESAWQWLSFAGLFALLLVALWLPYGHAAWRCAERRDVLTVVAQASCLLALLSLVMLIVLIGKYPPPQFNPAQTLSVCAQSLEYLGIFAVAFFPPMGAKPWRWTAVMVSLLLLATAAMSFRGGAHADTSAPRRMKIVLVVVLVLVVGRFSGSRTRTTTRTTTIFKGGATE